MAGKCREMVNSDDEEFGRLLPNRLWFDAGGAIVRKEGREKEEKEKREKRKKERRRVSYPHSHTL